MSRFLGSLLLVAIFSSMASSMDLNYAAKVRERVAAGDPAHQPAIDRLIAEADRALAAGPWTVTDKKSLAPTNDPKDYVSLAPYFWPDLAKPDGLPYINRDGEVNPATRSGDNSDRRRLQNMFETVQTLNIAAYMTGKPQYAKHTAEILRTFFLDSKTGMNPNLNFAQGVRGATTGRSYGLIDFNSAPEFLDSIRLMEQVAGNDVWTDSDRKGLHNWCAQFLDWMSTSKLPMEEERATNNHGAWFDATASSFADYLGDAERVKQSVARSKKRIESQIRADGTLPLELARTRSWHYTIFALQAFAITSQHARNVGADLWHHKPADPEAGDLSSAVSLLLHYSETKERWIRKDIDEPEDPAMLYLQIRPLLDPVRDAELCRRLDAAIAADREKLKESPQVLTFGPVP